MSNREELIFISKVCEQSERYQDMLESIKKIIAFGQELTVEERNLLSISCKNSISGKRSAWRCLESIQKREQNKNQTQHVSLIQQYKKKIKTQLQIICYDLIDLIDKSLLSGAKTVESQIFFHKMKGDYFRYISQVCSGDDYTKAGDSALSAYTEATNKASQLKTTNPIRLGLSLNFSVFYYEVKNNPSKACETAKNAFDDAIANVDDVDQSQYKDTTTIMQLLRDNLTLWTSQIQDQEVKKD